MNSSIMRKTIIFLAAASLIFVSNVIGKEKQQKQTGFLTAKGTKLYLNGKEYREISVNKFDLFHQTVLTELEPWRDKPSNIEKSLAELNKHNFRLIRVMCSPFYSAGFETYFFDCDPEVQKAKRKLFFERFDAMLDMCDRHNIMIICSLLWWQANLADLGHHSLHEGMTNPDSLSRKRVNDYISAVVNRYKNRTTIAIWEIGNEWNLAADLQLENGIISLPLTEVMHYTAPVVRNKQNNFTSEELAKVCREIATFIKSIDNKHLVTSGHSSPRPSAMHLLRAAKNGQTPDWTIDMQEELAEYIELIHPDPIDVIQIHFYDEAMTAIGKSLGDTSNIQTYNAIADKIGKPLIIGEIGLYVKMDDTVEDYRYPKEETISYIQSCLDSVIKNQIPITLYWTYCDDSNRGEDNWSLRYGATDHVLNLIEKANLDIKK